MDPTAEEVTPELSREELIELCKANYPDLEKWMIEGIVSSYLNGTLKKYFEEKDEEQK
jgi:hypothetical protein